MGFGHCRASLRGVPSSTSASPSALSLRAGPVGPPLLAPSASPPPPTWARASTPGSPRGSPSAGALPRARSRSASAVSHRPDGLLRSRFAGLFHPAAGPRFTVFQPLPTLAGRSGPPHGAARTLRRMPLVSSRAASPQPLPSCRSRAPGPCSPVRFGWRDRSLLPLRQGRRSVVRGASRSPSALRSSPRSGLPGPGGSSSVPPLHVALAGRDVSMPPP